MIAPEYEMNEFEEQEVESTRSYIAQLIQDKIDEFRESLGISTVVEDKIEALDEPIKELTQSEDLEDVKMVVNQVVRELNKLLS